MQSATCKNTGKPPQRVQRMRDKPPRGATSGCGHGTRARAPMREAPNEKRSDLFARLLRSDRKRCAIESPARSPDLNLHLKYRISISCVCIAQMSGGGFPGARCTGEAHSNWATIPGGRGWGSRKKNRTVEYITIQLCEVSPVSTVARP